MLELFDGCPDPNPSWLRANDRGMPRLRPAAPTAVAAVVGALLWTTTPWVESAVLGDRPYVGTAFDVPLLAGWLLMIASLAGDHAALADRGGRTGRVGLGFAGAGMALIAAVYARRVLTFGRAGFRAVPATGEAPAGLLLTYAVVVGFAATLAGVGLLGVGLRGSGAGHVTIVLLLAAPAVPAVLVVLLLARLLPTPLGRLLVSTNAVLVPLGVAWLALGRLLWRRSRRLPAGSD